MRKEFAAFTAKFQKRPGGAGKPITGLTGVTKEAQRKYPWKGAVYTCMLLGGRVYVFETCGMRLNLAKDRRSFCSERLGATQLMVGAHISWEHLVVVFLLDVPF